MNTLLIVDDDREVRDLLRSIAQRSPVPVSNIMTCGDGQAALEVLKSRRVDVMFTDIHMPKMDGVSLVEAMQGLEYRPRTVVISAYDDFAGAVRFLRMGVRDYLLKPIEAEKIVEVLGQMDEEIAEDIRNMRERKTMVCQQLKYMMLDAKFASREMAAEPRCVEWQSLADGYVVCCMEDTVEEPTESERYVCLNGVEDHRVYIVEEKSRGFLLKNELRDACVGVSRVHHGAAQLADAYGEAVAARAEAFVQRRHEVEYQEDMSVSRGEPEDEKMRQIAQMIGTDKVQTAVRLMEQYLAKVRREGYSGDVLAGSIDCMIHEVRQIYGSVLGNDDEELCRFQKIYRFSHMDELSAALTGWMSAFGSRMKAEFGDHKNRAKVYRAMNYIRQNYDKDLDMALVSNLVSMNYSLFSRDFKRYAGKSFVDYLRECRVEKARHFLAQTELRVVKISRLVGYENEKYFMKVFKDECGVSPTEYRRNMQLRRSVR